MSKKHKKKKKHQDTIYKYMDDNKKKGKGKKKLKKKMRKAMKEIEASQIYLYEMDKKGNRKQVKEINKKEKEFYTSMESLKARKKISKKWSKNGFLDDIIDLLKEVSPIVKTLAKAFCTLIISFLSIESIQKVIKPKTLSKIMTAFDFAMAI